LALVLLCAAYLQGGFSKLLDFPGAVAEARHFGLPLPGLAAALTIMVELAGSALVLSGRARWLGALGLAGFTFAANLLANRYWALSPGQERFMAANGFYEHLGLVGGFVAVALQDRPDWLRAQRRSPG
jgi:uncharacterized membrane protein YphA (DoxX/SURF4 family)